MDNKGFTFLEIVISLFILTVAMLGYSQIYKVSLDSSRRATQEIIATNLARGLLAEIMSKNFADPDSGQETNDIGPDTGETESEVTAFLNDLYRRGLEGKNLELIASDGAKGIRAAINMVYPYARWQLCYTHKLRNLSKNIRHKVKNRRKMMPQASGIFKAKSKRQAIKRFGRFCQRWQDIEPGAVRCFKKDFYNTLAYYDFQDDKKLIGTTNHLERDLEEVRRRIKIQGYFKNETSLNLWVYGIISQFREEQQPKSMPNYTFTIIKKPKYESVQLS